MNARRKKFLGFGSAKTITIGIISLISQAQSSVFLSVYFIHITHRTFRLDETIKAAQIYVCCETLMYIFDCQYIWKITCGTNRSTYKNI